MAGEGPTGGGKLVDEQADFGVIFGGELGGAICLPAVYPAVG